MSSPKPPTPVPAPADNGRPAKSTGAAVIRRLDGMEETTHERLIKKHVPAWVVSGAVHLTDNTLAWLVFGNRSTEATPVEKVLATTVEKEPENPDKDLTNEDPGLESSVASAVPELDKIAEKTVDAIVTDDPIGVPDARSEDSAALKDPGVPSVDNTTAGAAGDTGLAMSGTGGANGQTSASLSGRSGATKSKLLREGGGNEESERAVARGLAWLSRQQKQNGSWAFDGSSSDDTIAATGMALLPFLAAGETHKTGKKYAQTVDRGLKYLIANLNSAGKFNGKGVTMYSQGIATIALCEAYGMTKDKGFLLRPAQAAVSFIASN
ncbi:MAG: hypothetical protein JWO38_5799, partial [Gemmataceae bacterium]|nr:hypothetical protein [Gemmataceae bacterium]